MNQTQRNYIRKRVDGILQTKTAEARIKFTTNAIMLTNLERIRLIRNKKVKMRPESELDKIVGTYGINLNTVFDFSKHETKGGTDQVAIQKATKTLRAKANSINDKVMLGDSGEALKLVEDFEDFDY